MNIKGTVISSGQGNRMRADAVAMRKMRHEEMRERDAERQAMYRFDALKSAAQGAESKLAEIVKLYDRRAADVAGMREEAAETGRLHPALAGAVAELAEYPPMVALARTRAEAARAAYDSEVARQAADATEVEPEAEPVDDAPRGRGRPRKIA